MAIHTKIAFRDFDHYMNVVEFMCETFGSNWGFSTMVLKDIGIGDVTTNIIVDDSDAEILLMKVMLM